MEIRSPAAYAAKALGSPWGRQRLAIYAHWRGRNSGRLEIEASALRAGPPSSGLAESYK